jgi:GAF domain-containing protein
VHEFPGHIACDSASNSEIVVPIISPVTNVRVMEHNVDLYASLIRSNRHSAGGGWRI